MYSKVISVLTSISSHDLPKIGAGETTYPKVEAALGEGYTVKEVVSHQHGAVLHFLFVLEKAQ
jgi:hypothetical protein